MTAEERTKLLAELTYLQRELAQARKSANAGSGRSVRSLALFVGGLALSPVAGGLSVGLAFLGFVDMADNFNSVAEAERIISDTKREIRRIRRLLET